MAYSKYDSGDYRPGFGGFSFFPPVIKALILINVGVYLFHNFVIQGILTVGDTALAYVFGDYFYLQPFGENFYIWQLVTYMFLHGDFWHLFFNMLMLWMFGMEVENTWGSRKFMLFYFACGLTAALANLLITPLFTDPRPTIGASGGVYGVLVAFAMLFPNRHVYLNFFVPVRAKFLILFMIGLELYYGITGTTDGVAHMAHLGGAFFAVIWIILDTRGVLDRMLWSLQAGKSKRTRHLDDPVIQRPVRRDAEFFDIQEKPRESSPGRNDFDRNQKIIDEILDKISKQGYSGLTEEEKRILLDASRRIHPDA